LKPCHLHQLVFLVSCRHLNTHLVTMMLNLIGQSQAHACVPEHAVLSQTQHKAFVLDQACLAAWQRKK